MLESLFNKVAGLKALVPVVHEKVTHTFTNLHLLGAALFKHV